LIATRCYETIQVVEIGAGEHTYAVDHDWAQAGKLGLGYTHGIAVDSDDRVYVFNQSPTSVVVFGADGEVVDAWGEEFATGAHGFRLAGGYLFVTDIARGLVAKVATDGEVVFRVGAPARPDIYGDDRPYRPTDVAVAPDGRFFVTDGYGQHWVHAYSAEGELLYSFGGEGSELGCFSQPHGIWVDERGDDPMLYVADRRNERIQVLTLEGVPVRCIEDEIGFICGFHGCGSVLYVPDLHSRVTVLDESDSLLVHLGEDDTLWQLDGWPNRPVNACPEGSFIAPHAVATDSRGDLYVVEWVATGRITKLRRA
jgi:NHL repeat